MIEVTEGDLAAEPLVVVAVATHERPAGLQALLRALERQTLGVASFEVVIVDDASGDDTQTVLQRYVRDSTLRLHTHRLEPNRGPAVARNVAWRHSQAPIVAFTDDDCIPTARWLEEGLAAMRASAAVVVGATRPDPEQRHLIDPLSRTMDVHAPTFAPTCNVFYLRSDLEAVGGFDEEFRIPVGEDTDLAWRIRRDLGRDLRFVESALVYHDVRVRSFSQAVRETRRWSGIPPVVARHRDAARQAWHRGVFLRRTHERALLAAIGLLMGLVVPPALVLVAPWVWIRILNGTPRRSWVRNIRLAPAAFAIDILEIWVLLRGSIKHRALIL